MSLHYAVIMTIFDRRGASADGITLYYISPYRKSPRFDTKHVLTYLCIEVKKRIWKQRINNRDKVQHNIRSKDKNIRTKYERIKHHVYSMRLTGALHPWLFFDLYYSASDQRFSFPITYGFVFFDFHGVIWVLWF